MESRDESLNPFADPSVIAAQKQQSAQTNQPTSSFGYNVGLSGNAPSYTQPTNFTTNQTNQQPPFAKTDKPNVSPHTSVYPTKPITASPSGQREKNFPYIPPSWTWCCIKPCFYFNIEEDIPTEHQQLVRNQYYAVLGYMCVIVLNIIGTISYLILDYPERVIHLILSILVGPLLAALIFIFQYWLLYRASKTDNYNYYFWFLVNCICVIITLVIQTIGPKGSGWCGLMVVAYSFDGKHNTSPFMGILSLICSAGFLSFLAMVVYTGYKVRYIYAISKYKHLAQVIASTNVPGGISIPVSINPVMTRP